MSEPIINQSQVIQLFSEIATLREQVGALQKAVEAQEKTIDELIALVNKGKGSIWILLTLGGLLGAAISNIKQLLPFLAR